jgi:hypothetical protein
VIRQAQLNSPRSRRNSRSLVKHRRSVVTVRQVSNAFLIATFSLLLYGLAWDYSTQRYLKGFADAIVPLEGSPLEKSDALLNWLRHEPERTDSADNGTTSLRDPVNIVQNARLLKYCGSATNAFINLADAVDVNTRRLLLLDESGSAKHVVAEVESEKRWVVVDPSLGLAFKDRSGRALSKQELRDPKVFREAISRMPGYSPSYTFDHTAYVRLKRMPLLGDLLQRTLDRLSPGWEEEINWGYFPENPSLWPILVSVPLLLFGIFLRLLVDRYGRNSRGLETVRFRERPMKAGRIGVS